MKGTSLFVVTNRCG